MSSSFTTGYSSEQQYLQLEASLPQSFVWLLRLFSFLLDVTTRRLYNELQRVDALVMVGWRRLRNLPRDADRTTGGRFPSLGPSSLQRTVTSKGPPVAPPHQTAVTLGSTKLHPLVPAPVSVRPVGGGASKADFSHMQLHAAIVCSGNREKKVNPLAILAVF